MGCREKEGTEGREEKWQDKAEMCSGLAVAEEREPSGKEKAENRFCVRPILWCCSDCGSRPVLTTVPCPWKGTWAVKAAPPLWEIRSFRLKKSHASIIAPREKRARWQIESGHGVEHQHAHQSTDEASQCARSGIEPYRICTTRQRQAPVCVLLSGRPTCTISQLQWR